MLTLGASFLGIRFNDADLPASPMEWAWLVMGVGGTLIFGCRFFFQWIHSERHQESKIPVSFWWLSVVATIMTAGYFTHKRQWVALLGNGPQLIPYTRNLILIYRKQRRDREAALFPVVETLSAPASVPADEALAATATSVTAAGSRS